MKNFIFFTVPFLFFSLSSFSSSLIRTEVFGENPGNLTMYHYSPKGLADTVEAPLVVVLHGCSQNASQIAKQSGWLKLADANGFRLLFPEQKRLNNLQNCFNWFMKDDIVGDQGESASIFSMISTMEKKYKVDSENVCVYGLSAGAAMAMALVAERPTKFSGAIILAGGPYRKDISLEKALKVMQHPEHRTPSEWKQQFFWSDTISPRELPLMIIGHGDKDHTVVPESSECLKEQWLSLFSEDVVSIYENEDGLFDHARVRRQHYDLASDNKPVLIQYRFYGLGHALPVDPGKGERKGGKKGLFTKDLDFFSTWWFAYDLGLVK